MKISAEVKATQETEIELPYYFKLDYQNIGSTFYAIMDEETCIRVDDLKEITAIIPKAIISNLYNERFVETNKEEFETAFKNTIETLRSKVL